jgi:prepilin-type N-terminal cleavage/methylation domain-containing protein
MLKHMQSSSEWFEKNVAEKGVTLIELLVVIVILGILAAVAIFSVGGSNDKAKTNACKTEASTVEAAYAAFVAQSATNAKPTQMSDLRGAFGSLKKNPTYIGDQTFDWNTGKSTKNCGNL